MVQVVCAAVVAGHHHPVAHGLDATDRTPSQHVVHAVLVFSHDGTVDHEGDVVLTQALDGRHGAGVRSRHLGDGVVHLGIHAIERNLDVGNAGGLDGGKDLVVQQGQVTEDADREVVVARHVQHATEVRVGHGLAAREREGEKPQLVALVQDAAVEVQVHGLGLVCVRDVAVHAALVAPAGYLQLQGHEVGMALEVVGEVGLGVLRRHGQARGRDLLAHGPARP